MTVIMIPIKVEDKIPPEIYAGDVFFPLKFANSGKLTYDYLIKLFSAKDDFDGELTSIEQGILNGYFIEGYNEEDFLKASDETAIALKVVAVDKAGNRKEQEINCCLVDTKSRHIGNGRKKRFRFVSACLTGNTNVTIV